MSNEFDDRLAAHRRENAKIAAWRRFGYPLPPKMPDPTPEQMDAWVEQLDRQKRAMFDLLQHDLRLWCAGVIPKSTPFTAGDTKYLRGLNISPE